MTDELGLAKMILDTVPPVMHVIRRELRAAAHEELSVPQWRVLAHINRGIADATSLAELQGVSLPAISKMVDGLVDRELVERRFTKEDRRQAQLTLTTRGRNLYNRTREAAQKKMAETLGALSGEQRHQLEEGLKILARFADAGS